MPLGRGELGYYFGSSERNIDFDVEQDARAPLLDRPRPRRVLGGFVGLGTWRLGVLHPDRYAALVPLINPSRLVEGGAGAPDAALPAAPAGNPLEYQLKVVHGRLDPLAGGFSGDQAGHARAVAVAGDEFRYDSLLVRGHEVVPGVTNCVFLRASRARAVDDPAHADVFGGAERCSAPTRNTRSATRAPLRLGIDRGSIFPPGLKGTVNADVLGAVPMAPATSTPTLVYGTGQPGQQERPAAASSPRCKRKMRGSWPVCRARRAHRSRSATP